MNQLPINAWGMGLALVLASGAVAGGPPGQGLTAAGAFDAARAQQAPARPRLDPSRPATEQVPDAPPASAPGQGEGGGGGGVADIGLTYIDFESLRHDDALITDIGEGIGGEFYDEDGYFLTKNNGEGPFATFGTQEPRYPGSTALFNNKIGGTTYLMPVDNVPFTLVCMDISNLNSNGPVSVTFAGRRQDDTYVYKTVTTSVGYNRLETFYFEDFNNLIWVGWNQDSPFHQIDNIGVTKGTPELNFQRAEHVDGGTTEFGPIYAEGDFVITQGEGEAFGFYSFGTLSGLYPGSTALFNNTQNGKIKLTSLDSQEQYATPFNAHSIDLSNLNANGPQTVHFEGKKVDGNIVSQDFKIPGSGNGLHTFYFSGFHDLISLNWVQEAPFHQFDNISVSRGQRVLEFEKLRRVDGGTHGWGTNYREAGFEMETQGGIGFYSFGSQSGKWPGSTSLFNNGAGDLTTLRTIDDRQFAAKSIAIASLNGASPVTVKFTGTKVNGGQVNQSFTTSGNGQRLETFSFDQAKFRNITQLEWNQDSPYHQFDRIALVPQLTDVVGFQSLEHADDTYQDVGDHYSERGYLIRQGQNEPWPLTTYGTHTKNYPQSTAVFNNTIDGVIRLTTQSGNDFDLLEMDLAKLNPSGDPCAVTFVGTRTDGSQITQTFTIATPYNPNVNRGQTCHFEGFDSLKSVEWRQVYPYHQFDNISLVESVSDECYADFDGNGTLDLFDFLAYVNAFNAGGKAADCDGNGVLDLFDFLCYVNAFNAGC